MPETVKTAIPNLTPFKEGDRVRRSDVTPESIPAFRDLRGTVVGEVFLKVAVKWDIDSSPTLVPPDSIELDE